MFSGLDISAGGDADDDGMDRLFDMIDSALFVRDRPAAPCSTGPASCSERSPTPSPTPSPTAASPATTSPSTRRTQRLCQHPRTVEEHGDTTCLDCGLVVGKVLQLEREWRFNSDPAVQRCQARKVASTRRLTTVSSRGYPDRVVELAENIYRLVNGDGILRGKSRKASELACVYHAHESFSIPISVDTLMADYAMDARLTNMGIKTVGLIYKKLTCGGATPDSSTASARMWIPSIMDRINADEVHHEPACQIFEKVKRVSHTVIAAHSRSLCAAVVFFYMHRANAQHHALSVQTAVKVMDARTQRGCAVTWASAVAPAPSATSDSAAVTAQLQDFATLVDVPHTTIAKLYREICAAFNQYTSGSFPSLGPFDHNF
jgi:transcription initiation factor TFIIIB Brf1 subunit/transcription initiation factor TFIIB